MRYISVCSGIEAASVAWEPLGWKPVAFAEIEAFPSAVLAHHYPDVPNLGDISKVDWRPYHGTVDLVVGGTPCQDFSIAGKRAGLAGERSALALEFIRLLQEAEPDYFIWENVPGCLSTNKGQDFKILLEAFQEAGYILDVDILDAQFFGVPQRRRRVFVCGINLDSIPKKKTISSSAIIAKCLLSILQSFLEGKFSQLEKGLVSSEFNANLNDGLQKKINFLFKRGKSMEDWMLLLNALNEGFQKLLIEQKNLAVTLGGTSQQECQGGLWLNSSTEAQCLLTEESWKRSLDDLSHLRELFTTSTATKTTTQEIISVCSRIVLNIGKLIILMKSYYPNLSIVDISDLTAIKEYTKYARWTNSSLLGGDGQHSVYWNDFIRQAEHLNHIVGHLGNWRRPAQVLFEPDSLRRDTPKGAKTRKSSTASAESRTGVYTKQRIGEYADCGKASTCSARDYKDATDLIVGTLAASGAGTSRPAGQGNELDFLVPLPINMQVATRHKSLDRGTGFGVGEPGDPAYTLQAQHSHAVAAMTAELLPRLAVRRLTPTECERLQGFPDGWTVIPWRGKDHAPDGPRYKALGNSMAVPCMRWIGARIQAVEEICPPSPRET